MSVTPVDEADLYAALRPFQADPVDFEAAVQQKIQHAETQLAEGLVVEPSPMLEMAAAFLPLPLLAGGKVPLGIAKMAPLAGKYKLLGYLALPAISLFLLIGSAVFGSRWIQQIQRDNAPERLDRDELVQASKQWWSRYKWPAILFYALVLLLPFLGSTWLLFLLLLASTGALLFVVTTLAKQGIGSRMVVGQSCVMGLGLLGQVVAGMPGIGEGAIHFFDQKLLSLPFFLGSLVLGLLTDRYVRGYRSNWGTWVVNASFIVWTILIAGLCVWFAKPTVLPLTPVQIKQHVEQFDHARYSSSSWRSWEKVAVWTQQAGLDPDLSNARQLLADEIAGEQNPFVLGSAFRVGLVEKEQIVQLEEFENRLSPLLRRRRAGREPQQISSIAQQDWVIRAALLQGVLTDDDRDHLQGRLLATWDALAERPSLEDALYVMQLLKAIDRPIDREQYRAQVHDWLRQFHSTEAGGFQLAGGFKLYASERVRTGDLRATWCAIELMKKFGIPEGFDMNWVRSFLKPVSMTRQGDRRYLAAVTRDNMQRLPGIHQPTWLEYVVVERSLLAAIMLVVLCIYATMSSPVPEGEAR